MAKNGTPDFSIICYWFYTTAPITTKSMTPRPPQQRVILQENLYKKCEGTAHASEYDDKGKEYIQMPFFSYLSFCL